MDGSVSCEGSSDDVGVAGVLDDFPAPDSAAVCVDDPGKVPVIQPDILGQTRR